MVKKITLKKIIICYGIGKFIPVPKTRNRWGKYMDDSKTHFLFNSSFKMKKHIFLKMTHFNDNVSES